MGKDEFAEVAGWSPDGARLLVSARGQLFVANADGTGTMQPIPNTEGAYSADWSPDGEMIAFVTDASIYIVDADGSGVRFLVAGEDVRWAPDGGRIAFNGYRAGGGHQPSLINPDGSGLVPFPGTSEGPELRFQSWSPDGAKALLTGPGASGDDDEFYSINVDGTGLMRITDDGVYTLGGSWGP
jgi:Tol biopolymer transport system component